MASQSQASMRQSRQETGCHGDRMLQNSFWLFPLLLEREREREVKCSWQPQWSVCVLGWNVNIEAVIHRLCHLNHENISTFPLLKDACNLQHINTFNKKWVVHLMLSCMFLSFCVSVWRWNVINWRVRNLKCSVIT